MLEIILKSVLVLSTIGIIKGWSLDFRHNFKTVSRVNVSDLSILNLSNFNTKPPPIKELRTCVSELELVNFDFLKFKTEIMNNISFIWLRWIALLCIRRKLIKTHTLFSWKLLKLQYRQQILCCIKHNKNYTAYYVMHTTNNTKEQRPIESYLSRSIT